MVEFSTFELIALLWAVVATLGAGYYRSVVVDRERLVHGAAKFVTALLANDDLYNEMRDLYKRHGAEGVGITSMKGE